MMPLDLEDTMWPSLWILEQVHVIGEKMLETIFFAYSLIIKKRCQSILPVHTPDAFLGAAAQLTIGLVMLSSEIINVRE